MSIVTVLLYTFVCCFVNNVLSDTTETPHVGVFLTKLPMFCHSVLHHGDFTSTTLRIFDMKEFIKGNPQFPPSVSILTDLVARIQRRIREQNGETKSRLIQLDCLDVLKDNQPSIDGLINHFAQLKPYFDNRPQLSKVLSAVTTLAKNANSAALTSLTTICQESRVSPADVKNQFLSITNLAAAAGFDLARLNLLILTMIGDFYRYQIVEGVCGKSEAELATIRNDWAEIEVRYQEQEKYLLENWAKEKLNDDVKTKVEQSVAPGNTDPFPWPDTSIQRFLEHKYYWNAFRVHVYPKEKVADVERFLCKNADTYPKTACVKGGDKIAVVHYQPLADEKLNKTEKILDRRAPPPELKSLFEGNQDKPSPSNKFSAARASLDMTGVLEPAAQTALDKFFPKETVIKGTAVVTQSVKHAKGVAKIFKGILKFAVNIGKFLGPLAMGITGLLGVLLDEGTTNVMEEMREGFKDMSNEFRKLNTKLDSVKNEIIDAAKSEAWMSSFHVSYFERVKTDLSRLRKEFKEYDNAIAGPSEGGERAELIAFCDPLRHADNVKSPVGVLSDMHKYFVSSSTDGKSFPEALKDWKDAKSHRPTLQLLLAGLLMDATDLQAMVQRCMPILVKSAPEKVGENVVPKVLTKKQVAATYVGKLALAQRQAYEIKKVIFELNQAQLYGWMELIDQTVDGWTPPEGADVSGRAASLAATLQGKYDWNGFNVFAFKNNVKGYASEAHVLHPDYTKIRKSGDYTYVINWANRDEPLSRVKQFPGGHDNFYWFWCEHINTASVLLDRVSEFGVPLGTKSVYIRKDIFEEGFYGRNNAKGNTVRDVHSGKYLDFKEPQACCGATGELSVSYGPHLCWIDKNESKQYCTRTKLQGFPGREICDTWGTVTRWERQGYAVAMNSGAGY